MYEEQSLHNLMGLPCNTRLHLQPSFPQHQHDNNYVYQHASLTQNVRRDLLRHPLIRAITNRLALLQNTPINHRRIQIESRPQHRLKQKHILSTLRYNYAFDFDPDLTG